MGACSEYIKNVFPSIDDDLKQYVEGKEMFTNLLLAKMTFFRRFGK